MDDRLNRRNFLALGGLTVAGLAVTSGGATAAEVRRAAPIDAPLAPQRRPVLDGLRYWYPVARHSTEIITTDVCVYGGTSAGVTAAVQAMRAGRSVALATFGSHVGGLTASGLGHSDVGTAASIGGLSQEFYTAVGTAYGATGMTFEFEPHVAEEIFESLLAGGPITHRRQQRLASVASADGRLTQLTMEDGTVFRAKVFVDATYEGDLLGKAGVSYTVGRESNQVYGEAYNGVQFGNGDNQFTAAVDPYRRPGKPSSGLIPGVSAGAPGTPGSGDSLIQAYNFRLCLSGSNLRRPYPEPEGYDPGQYELLARYIEAGVFDVFGNTQPLPGNKLDMNNNGAVATDDIGQNYAWPEADYPTRETIFQNHVRYQAGLLKFLATDPGLPRVVRDYALQFGFTADEFTDTSGWPHDLYVREGRRMVSDYVMTEHNSLGRTAATDSIALASYVMDSHHAERVVVDGKVANEGNVQVHVPGPFPISYRSIVPRRGECENLLVAGALSASHVAFGSLRLEPVFMMLGQAAGMAASLALDSASAVQDVDYATLRSCLTAAHAVLDWPA